MRRSIDQFWQQIVGLFSRTSETSLYYIVEDANWSTDWDGHYITKGVSEQFDLDAQITTFPSKARGQIIHYGSLWSFVAGINSKINRRNGIVTTIFHGNRDTALPALAEGVELLIAHADQNDRIVTSCSIMQKRLVSWGIPADKVVCIPLGVDTEIFKPTASKEQEDLRVQLGIPRDAFVIGSFQKDGNGWEEGLTPKLIKGPDIFLKVIEQVTRQHKVFVLLSGPARGYVKQGLEKMGVPYYHEFLDNYLDIVPLYHCLDAYLVPSREEGGPKGILEALATGVPLVSTRVGLAPDVIDDGANGLLADLEDVDQLAKHISNLIKNAELGRRLVTAGLETIPAYDWNNIARQYYEGVYKPLLDEIEK
ncbi:MAG: glycosyltransferase [Chloroflexi bacterium]|nr:MAG: glycosyltransferase [Chloroflexota bacterium]MBL1193075.1 glycosyltransferase [Chloroflexota bacterium]NOH10368.1 glycosyltransferase family 4 protein [Chloroflexota bacterium]